MGTFKDHLGSSLGPLGLHWGALAPQWPACSHLWGPLGLWGYLFGSILAPLGSFWGLSGSLLAPLGLHLGALGHHFGAMWLHPCPPGGLWPHKFKIRVHFGSQKPPEWNPKVTKNNKKRHQKRHR